MIRALIAEDEPLARAALRDLIEDVAWLELVGEAEDGAAALRMINDLEPDLVFLDVQMPELTGLEVLGAIENQPAIVFTTAFDRYAVAAFELEAIDYLVKPLRTATLRRHARARPQPPGRPGGNSPERRAPPRRPRRGSDQPAICTLGRPDRTDPHRLGDAVHGCRRLRRGPHRRRHASGEHDAERSGEASRSGTFPSRSPLSDRQPRPDPSDASLRRSPPRDHDGGRRPRGGQQIRFQEAPTADQLVTRSARRASAAYR